MSIPMQLILITLPLFSVWHVHFPCRCNLKSGLPRTDLRSTDPADHLISLLPSNTYAHQTTHRQTIVAYLENARLPNETLGLAACVLGNISNSFVRAWRQDLFYARISRRSSECIILAAICISASFLDDSKSSTVERWLQYGRSNAGDGVWPSKSELSTTVRCVLKEIDYELHSFSPEVIAGAVQDLSSGRNSKEPYSLPRHIPCSDAEFSSSAAPIPIPSPTAKIPKVDEDLEDGSRRDSGYGGTAMWIQGVVTPEPTPPMHTPVDPILGGTFLPLL